jgi:hypothetical protein
MYDLKLSHASSRLSRPLAAGATVSEEGKILVAVLEDGVEKVMVKDTVDGDEVVIGFASLGDAQPSQTSEVEEVAVPSAGALEADLRNTNLVSGRVRVVVKSSGQVLTVDTTYAGSPADNTVKVDLPTGRLKFHADEAGEVVVVTYIHDLTIQQSIQKFGERHVNNRNLHAMHGQMEVASGIGELYTDQYDASADWASGGALKLGDGGIIAKSGAGVDLKATVVSVPSSENPLLGIRFNFTA